MKTCSKCKETKNFDSFKKDRSKKDGLSSSCKDCHKKHWAENYHLIAEKHRARTKLYAEKNTDRIAEYQKSYKKKNKVELYEKVKKWRKDNNGWANFLRTNSKPRYKRAMPPWADIEKMKEFYIEADRLTNQTGVKYSVDHIIPIKGKNVSGLHVETNLQILRLTENISKHNKFFNYSKEVLT